MFSLRMLFTSVAAVVLLCLVGLQGKAIAGITGKIAGRVMDASGKPLPGANVALVGTRRGTVSDVDGFYIILLVEPGVYELEASLIGYQKVRKKEVKVLVDFTTTVNFRLKETAVEAEEVVVTAERPAVEPDKTASKFYVTAKDIEMTPLVKDARAFAGLQPGVQHDGLSVRQGSFEMSQQSDPRELGYATGTPAPVGITYAVDGVRMVNADGRVPNLFVGVNRSSIQEISIVTGVPEAEYGNMDAGIINIVTKEGGRDFRGFLEYRYTQPGQRHFGFNAYDPRAHINTATGKSRIREDDPAWLEEKDAVGRLVHVQPDRYDKVAGNRMEASLSGPVGTNASFHVSYLTDMQPVQRPAPAPRGLFNYQVTSKLVFGLTPQLSLKVGGVFGRRQEFLTGFNAALAAGQDIYLPAWKSGAGKELIQDWMGYGVLTHSLSPRTLYEVRFSRSQALRDTSGIPDETEGIVRDKDNWFTVGRRVRHNRVERETRHNLKVDFSSQMTKGNFFKTGMDVTWYRTWQWDEGSRGSPGNVTIQSIYDYSKASANRWGKDGKIDFVPIRKGTGSNVPDFSAAGSLDDPAWNSYRDFPRHAFHVSAYVQDKMEFEGMVVNVGVRYDGLYHRGGFRPEAMWSGMPTFKFFSDSEAGLYRQAQKPYPQDPLSFPTWGGRNFHRFAPRFGVSHPITDRSAAHFSYGRFMVLPIFYTMYGWMGTTFPGMTQHMDLNGDVRLSSYEYNGGLHHGDTPAGNPGMKPPTTVNYELGMDWNFVADYTATATMFYRRAERYQTHEGARFQDPASKSLVAVTGFGNSAQMETRGLELSVSKRFSNYFSFRATYSWYWEHNTSFTFGGAFNFLPDANFLSSGAYRYAFDIDKTTGERIYRPLTQQEIAVFGQYADTQVRSRLETTPDVQPTEKFKDARLTLPVGLYITDEKNIAVTSLYTTFGAVRGPNDQRDAPSDGSFTFLLATPPGFGPGLHKFRPLSDLNLNLVLRIEPGTFFKFISSTPSPSSRGKLVKNQLIFRNPTYFGTDLGVEKGFRVGKVRPVVFFEATNLFNMKKPKPISRGAIFNDIPKYGFAQNQPTPEQLRTSNIVRDEWDSYQNRTRELYFGVRVSM